MKIILSESQYNDLSQTNTQFLDDQLIFKQDENWQPLYIWLEAIFGKKYEDAADSFMYMQTVFSKKYKIRLCTYKHYRTRKSITLDQNGWPYVFLNEKNTDLPNHLQQIGGKTVGFEKTDNKTAFNKIYGDLIKWIKDYEENNKQVCVDGMCMKPSFFEKQSEIFPLILKQLKDNGWEVLKYSGDNSVIDNSSFLKKT